MTKRKKPEADFPVNLDNVPITNKMLSLATSELSHSIYALDYKIEAQFKGIDARLIEMDAKWEARLNAMDAKLDAMQARSDAHFKDLKGLVEVIAKKVADTLLLTEQQKTQNQIAMEAVQVYRESFDDRLKKVENYFAKRFEHLP